MKALALASPALSRSSGTVAAARAVLSASPTARLALALDPALGRFTTAAEEALARADPPASLEPLLALSPRFAVTAALVDGGDADLPVVTGSGGRARLPADGRVLQGPAGRALRVEVRAGTLVTHARPPRTAGPFEVADGDAEGGRLPKMRPLSGGDAYEAARRLEPGVACFAETAPALLAEAAALAPVLVPVHSDASVSHSASVAGARACIWLSAPDRPLVVAETLVHEASHLKFLLAEDGSPFTPPDDPPRFSVPWRPDPRPARAVLMGLHAWVRVVLWLRTLDRPPFGQAASERLPVLLQATRASLDLCLEIAADPHALTEEGRALVSALSARLGA